MPTLLTLEHATLARADRVILDGVDFSVSTGERVALLGRNGAGKTTLLDVLAGVLRPDEGELWRADGLRLAVLPQHPTFEGSGTVAELVDAANPYEARQAELGDLAARLTEQPELLSVWAQRQADFEAEGGYTYAARASATLDVLGLRGMRGRVAATLSGGERTRLALALALLREPDLLLLDEPTNHLDLRMREWLEDRLLSWRGAVVMTSHDRELLDRAATRSVWIEAGRAVGYAGGYSAARAQRDLERRTRARAHRLGHHEQFRLAGAASRESRWGRRAAPLRSRQDRVEVVEAPLPERRARMRLLAGSARARLLVTAEHLTKRYGRRAVLHDVSLRVRQGDRIVLLGANGTGKTTLLRMLAGELYPDNPDARVGFESGVTVATLDQTWHGLHADRAVLTQFTARFGDGPARALLGRAGFTATDWPKTPRELSGGERARAGLALVGGLRADLLLLDEPTNHLDVDALEALEEALAAYPGACLIVTHDRRFAREVATRVWQIEDARLVETQEFGSRVTLDPARTLRDDPPPPPAPASAGERAATMEDRLSEIEGELTFGRPTGREEARLRSEAHRLRHELSVVLNELYGEPNWDRETREGGLVVRLARTGRGAAIWAGDHVATPHLAWNGETLTWMGGEAERTFVEAVTRAALRLLFEREGVATVRFPGGAVVTRAEYLEAEELL